MVRQILGTQQIDVLPYICSHRTHFMDRKVTKKRCKEKIEGKWTDTHTPCNRFARHTPAHPISWRGKAWASPVIRTSKLKIIQCILVITFWNYNSAKWHSTLHSRNKILLHIFVIKRKFHFHHSKALGKQKKSELDLTRFLFTYLNL